MCLSYQLEDLLVLLDPPNNIKYLGKTLTKEVKDLYDKNFKSLKKEIKDLRRWKDPPCT